MGTPDDQSVAGRDAREAEELAAARRAEMYDAEAKHSRHSAVQHMDAAGRFEKLAEDEENSGHPERAEVLRDEAATEMAEASRAAYLAKEDANAARIERLEAGDHAYPHEDPHDPFNSIRKFQQDFDRYNATHVTGDAASATTEHNVRSHADPMGLDAASTTGEGGGLLHAHGSPTADPYDAGSPDGGGYDTAATDASGYDVGSADASGYDTSGYDTGSYDTGSYDTDSSNADGYDDTGGDA